MLAGPPPDDPCRGQEMAAHVREIILCRPVRRGKSGAEFLRNRGVNVVRHQGGRGPMPGQPIRRQSRQPRPRTVAMIAQPRHDLRHDLRLGLIGQRRTQGRADMIRNLPTGHPPQPVMGAPIRGWAVGNRQHCGHGRSLLDRGGAALPLLGRDLVSRVVAGGSSEGVKTLPFPAGSAGPADRSRPECRLHARLKSTQARAGSAPPDRPPEPARPRQGPM